MMSTFARDVDEGLSSNPKRLSSMYFYDDRGSELFAQIMELPEYYLTRSEMEIMTYQSDDIVEAIHMPRSSFDLIELGAGNGLKTVHLLEALLNAGYTFDFKPIDISSHALDELGTMLHDRLPMVSYKPLHGDYFQRMAELASSDRPKTMLFLGSNLGNMTDRAARDFLDTISSHLHPGDALVLGLDLIKPADIVLPAYNDAAGVTRAFNLNLLTRINRELGGNFDVDNFEHSPTYDPKEGVARSFLTVKADTQVQIEATGRTYHFTAGERIAVEQSRKYDDDILGLLIQGLPWRIQSKLTDAKRYFADYILKRT